MFRPGLHDDGHTLIELLVTVSILIIVLAVGVPSFISMISNSKIRTVADSALAGLQLARSEAVRSNARIRFSLIDANGGWQVQRELVDGANQPLNCQFDDDDSDSVIQKTLPTSRSNNVTVQAFSDSAATVQSASDIYVFGPNGWRACANLDQFQALLFDNPDMDSEDKRALRLTVSRGGSMRLCDPQVAAGDTRACRN